MSLEPEIDFDDLIPEGAESEDPDPWEPVELDVEAITALVFLASEA